MSVRDTAVVFAWVFISVFVTAPAEGWQTVQPASQSAVTALESPHDLEQRMHERGWSNIEFDWREERQRIVGLVCELGLIAIALVDCGWIVAFDDDAGTRHEGRLPESEALTPPAGIDGRDLKTRMNSI